MNQTGSKYKGLGTRLISAVLGATLLLACILWNQWSFGFIFMGIGVLCLFEFYKMSQSTGNKPLTIIGIIIGIYTFALLFAMPFQDIPKAAALAPIFFPLIAIVTLFKKKENPLTDIAITFMGIFYIIIPMGLLSSIAFFSGHYSGEFILSIIALHWVSDTFAYFTGLSIGKHKLFERISPKKTWEGAIGGLLFTLAGGYIASLYIEILSVQQWLIVSGIISIAGILGDLTESMIKRSFNLKDSGNILPGHGGLLDRFDAFLISVPFIVMYLFLINT